MIGGADLPVAALKGDLAKLDRLRLGGAVLTGAKLTAADGGLEIAELTLIELRDGVLGRAAVSGFHMSFPDEDLGPVELVAAEAGGTEIAFAALAARNDGARPEGLLGSFDLA